MQKHYRQNIQTESTHCASELYYHILQYQITITDA